MILLDEMILHQINLCDKNLHNSSWGINRIQQVFMRKREGGGEQSNLNRGNEKITDDRLTITQF